MVLLFSLGLTLLVGAVSYPAQPAAGQGGAIVWSRETVLARINGVQPQTFFPVLAADPYGRVHLFWTQGKAIYYMQKDAAGWTNPIDVVWSDGAVISSPSVAIDKTGVLHLVWHTFGQIWHKTVPSWAANDLHQWSPAKAIGQFGGGSQPLRIAVDPENRLHILFADWFGAEGVTKPGNVYHIQSEDGGETWTNFEQVSSVQDGNLATDPRMAFDDKGQVHIVWGEMSQSNGLQLGVYYNRLSKDGRIMMQPVQIGQRNPDDKWLMDINIAIPADHGLNVVWVCGVQAQRCTARSTDGGDTWSNPQRIFVDLIGLSGWDSLVVDGGGNLYWLTVLRYPQAMYYSAWNGASWNDPPVAASTDDYMKLGENVIAVVGLGNHIHMVIQLGNVISYMEGVTTAPKVAPLQPPQPTPTGSPETTPTPAAALDSGGQPNVTAAQTGNAGYSKELMADASSPQVFVISTALVAGLVFLVGAVYILRQRRL